MRMKSIKKHYAKEKLLFIFILLTLYSTAFSQLTVTPNSNANNLAQQIVGTGVQISNMTLNCGNQASGIFNYSGVDLGLSNGILLTTGIAAQATTPFGNSFMDNVNGNNFADPDLIAISSTAKYDVCILQFDFIPICDTMKFGYVFGSDEYPKYINQYNDAFGVFLTGPNPSGGNYNAKNIATLPTGTPVEINTVNGGWPLGTGASNSAYYIDNYPPDGTNTHNFDFYGFTLPLTSVTPVLPCNTYHMKIAVADAGNGHNDSGVFIKGNSVTCQSGLPAVTAVSTSNCSSSANAYVSVVGYTGTPTYNWSPGGMTTDTITNLSPGTYSCTVGMQSQCGAPYSQVVTAVVSNSQNITSSASVDSTIGFAPLTVQFSNVSSTNITNWFWVFGDGTTGTGTNPTHTYNTAGTYTAIVTVSNASGCSTNDTVVINVRDLPSDVFIPNVFTPNGDGVNDTFYIPSKGIIEFDMKIYDRWGILLFESTSSIKGWDGKTKNGNNVSDGTYYYLIEAKGIDGKFYKYNGFLTLIG